jgi:hypothetical protein
VIVRWQPGRAWRWPVALVVLSVVAAVGLVWLAGADVVDGQPLMLLERPLPLHNRQELGQTIRAPGDGVYRVDVFFFTQGEERSRQVRFLLFGSDGLPVVDYDVPAADLRDTWHSFTFPPIEGVAGDILRLDLRRNAPVRDALSVWIGPGSSYPHGYGVIDNVPDPSFDLAFRVYAATPPDLVARARRVVAIASDLTAGRTGPTSQPALLLGLGGVYAVGMAALGLVGVALLRGRR